MILNFININKQKQIFSKQFLNNKFSGAISLLHSGSVVCSDRNHLNVLNDAFNTLNSETVSNLQVIKFEGAPGQPQNPNDSFGVNSDLGISSSVENFPWLFDENGQYLKLNDPITLFDSIKLISNFLEKKYQLDPNVISEIKLKEIIDLFEKGDSVSIIELLNHVGKIYTQNKDSIVKEITTSSNGEQDLSGVINTVNKTKALGTYGDITINEIAEKMLNLRWDIIWNRTELTIHALPVAVNLISFSTVLRSYMKHVHNRPFDQSIGAPSIQLQKSRRLRELGIFTLLGLPISLIALRFSSLGLKNAIDISITGGAQIEENPINSVGTLATPSMSHFGLFLLLSKINNKIPSWVKLALKILFTILTILKLLGYSIISDVLMDNNFLVKLVYIYCTLVIIYQLLNLYLVYKFSTKKVQISEILPDFLIKWLQEFELIARDKIFIKEVKKDIYIHISIYILTMVLITLIS